MSDFCVRVAMPGSVAAAPATSVMPHTTFGVVRPLGLCAADRDATGVGAGRKSFANTFAAEGAPTAGGVNAPG